MKKLFLIAFSAAIFFNFTSCGSLIDDGKLTHPDVSISSYKKVEDSVMEFPDATDDTSLYMFVYNLGEETATSDEYANIVKKNAATPVQNSIARSVQQTDYSDESYDGEIPSRCSISLKKNQKALELLKRKSSTRSIARNAAGEKKPVITFDREKYQKAANIGDKRDFIATRVDESKIDGDEDAEYYEFLTATCVYSNDTCQIFVEDGYYDETLTGHNLTVPYTPEGKTATKKLTKTGVKELGDNTAKILAATQELYGSYSALNDERFDEAENIIRASEKFTVLVANIGRPSSTKSSMISGYFCLLDFFCNEIIDGELKDNWDSNEAILITINIHSYDDRKKY